MISNLILQDTVNGIRSITKADLCIAELDGKVIATTKDDMPVKKADILSFAESKADTQEIAGYHYFKVYDDYQLEYILVVVSDSEDVTVVGKMAAFQIKNLLIAYKEHFDKDNFIKNLLLDNLFDDQRHRNNDGRFDIGKSLSNDSRRRQSGEIEHMTAMQEFKDKLEGHAIHVGHGQDAQRVVASFQLLAQHLDGKIIVAP